MPATDPTEDAQCAGQLLLAMEALVLHVSERWRTFQPHYKPLEHPAETPAPGTAVPAKAPVSPENETKPLEPREVEQKIDVFLVESGALVKVTDAARAHAMAELDARSVTDTEFGLRTGGFIAYRTHTPTKTAKRRVHVSRRLRDEFPALRDIRLMPAYF